LGASGIDFDTLNNVFDCVRCGTFEMTFEAQADFPSFQDPQWLRCAARQESELGRRLRISNANQAALVRQHQSTTVEENAERLTHYVARKAPRPGLLVNIEPEYDYPIIDVQDQAELLWYLKHLDDEDVIEGGAGKWKLSFEGWKRLRSSGGTFVPGTCFVAMAFAPDYDFIFQDGIRPALIEARFEPVCMKYLLTNEDINFRILAEIRKSEIVVADLTGQRGGVYFEAGFALGLGREVFWTCRKSELDQVHFDTNHFQYTDWESAVDLRERLRDKIIALKGYGTAKH